MQTPLFEIKNFNGGMTLSDTIGNENQFKIGKNLDFEAKPGKLTCGLAWYDYKYEDAAAMTATIQSIFGASNGTIYLGGSDTRIYEVSGDVNLIMSHDSSAAGAVSCFAEYGDYTYYSQGNKIGRINLTGSEVWNDSWQILTQQAYRPMFSSTNNKLYIGNGNYVASYDDSSYISGALDLPASYLTRDLTDFGWRYLAIGANKVASSNFNNAKEGKIFLWDRNNTSSWQDEIIIPEKSIHALIFSGGYLWFWAGDNANIYVVPEGSRKATKMFEFQIEEHKETKLSVYPQSVTELNGKIYFGLSDNDSQLDYSKKLHPRNPTGIYSFPSDPNNFKLNLERNNHDIADKYYSLSKATDILYTGVEHSTSASATVFNFQSQIDSGGDYAYQDDGEYESFIYRPQANSQMFIESFGVEFEPLPYGCSINMYYKKEGDTDWNTVFEAFTTDDATEKIVLKKVKAKQLQIKITLVGSSSLATTRYFRPFVERIWCTGHLIPRLPH